MISFTFWYLNFLFNNYILSASNENKIRGVPLSIFQKPMRLVLIINTTIAICLFSFGILCKAGFIPAIGWFVSSILMYLILQTYVKAKFVSEILKRNPSLQDFDLSAIYDDVRKLLVKNLIK